VNETDVCPRCGGGFHCGVKDAGPCACTTIPLSAELLAQLRANYTTCLCQACLVELAAPTKKPASLSTGRL
jgi:hypothetical protein